MIKKLMFIGLLLLSLPFHAQLLINEIDTDTNSTDVLEFVEIKSETPFTSLNGYILTFYNGSSNGMGNSLYYKIDLTGITTDINGLALIGNQLITPVPNFVFPNNTIQNGADVIAIYRANFLDFEYNTPATASNLIDAVAYTKSNGDLPTALMQALNLTQAYNENENSRITSHSLQRQNNGTFLAANPTPFLLNDGTGIIMPTLRIEHSVTGYLNEGDSFTISIQSSQVATSDVVFQLSLNNYVFNSSDFSGNVNLIIPQGSSSISTTIQTINDGITEGDEELSIKFNNFPELSHKLANDAIKIRVIDANIAQRNFGRPTQPTYANVQSSAPNDYYASAVGLSGENLKLALREIISNENIVRKHNYGDALNIIQYADQDPLNSSHVWLMYKEISRPKLDYQGANNSNTGLWNREHIYPQSRGGFSEGTEDIADGSGIWEFTNSSDFLAGHSDAHHIRPEDGPENSSRGNKNYGLNEYFGPENTNGSWKGDVARALFYMVTRYESLSIENGYPTNQIGRIGDLETILNWHNQDIADDYEMFRNNYVYTWQFNRNPFIDYPELISYIWGANQNQPWNPTLSSNDFNLKNIKLHPNPSSTYLTISGITNAQIKIYSASGALVYMSNILNDQQIIHNLPSGVYQVIVNYDNQIFNKKLIVK